MNPLVTFAVALLALPAVGMADDSPATELSIPLLDHVTYPDDRPEWIETAPDLEGSADDTKTRHRLVVVSGPSDSPEAAIEERELLAKAAVLTYASGLLGTTVADFDPLRGRSWDDLVSRSYEGTVTQADSPHFEAAWELTFDGDDRAALIEAGKNVEVRNRLAMLGVMLGGGFVMLLGSGGVLNLLSRRKA